MMKIILERYIGSLVRHALTFLSGILVTNGILHDDGGTFVATNYEVIMGLITFAIAQGFSFSAKKSAEEKIEAAKEAAKDALRK